MAARPGAVINNSRGIILRISGQNITTSQAQSGQDAVAQATDDMIATYAPIQTQAELGR